MELFIYFFLFLTSLLSAPEAAEGSTRGPTALAEIQLNHNVLKKIHLFAFFFFFSSSRDEMMPAKAAVSIAGVKR